MSYRSIAARHLIARHLAAIGLIAGVQAWASPGWAQSTSTDPTFGNRTENPNGSVALSVGRRVQSEWDAKFGVDASLAPESGPAAMADRVLQGPAPSHSSGTVWGTVTGEAPLFWDRTSVDARLDPAQDQGRVTATMSRTLTLGDNASVTLQDKYSVTQSLLGGAGASQPALTAIPPGASVWETERSLRFNLTPTGTTLSAGVATLSGDTQWHNRISAEQQLGGPLSITTSVTDPASSASTKSISARFKHTW